MYASEQNHEVAERIRRHGVNISDDDAGILRRAELTLQRWSEAECGNSNDYGSWSIERDEETGKPFRCYYPNSGGTVTRTRIPDREAGAERRIRSVCAKYGLVYYMQPDCRGCMLYVSRPEALNGLPKDQYYSSRMIHVGGRR